MRLGTMTWEEVASYLERRDALIVPVGTCEQHGRHLPLSTDAIITEAYADALAAETGVPSAPLLAYGVNLPCDRFMAGTAGLSHDALRSSLRGLLRDWVRQGFRTFFIVTAHGCAMNGFGFSHQEAIKEAALPLLTEGGCRAFVLFPYWTDVSDLLERQDGVEHAGEVETSLLLYLRPELVRQDLADGGAVEGPETRYEAYPEGVEQAPTPGRSGAEGHPEAGDAEKGRRIFERTLRPLVELMLANLQSDGASKEEDEERAHNAQN
jgi:creatinine amidohydrolase